MKLVWFGFRKILGERLSNSLKDLKVKTSIKMDEIKENESINSDGKEMFLDVKFGYKIDYEPNVAKLEFTGIMTISVEAKKGKEILKQWKKKDLSEEVNISFLNVVMNKSNVKALQLEEELNLPYHFSLPVLRFSKNQEGKN